MSEDGTAEIGKNDPLGDYRRKFHLAAGEELLWAGRPDPVVLVRVVKEQLRTNAWRAGIFWLVVAVVLSGVYIASGEPGARIAVVLIFLAAIAAAVLGVWSWIRKLQIGQGNIYGVTSRQVILLIRNLNGTTTYTHVPYADVNALKVVRLGDGAGDVHLREMEDTPVNIFMSAIPNAEVVAQMIRERLPTWQGRATG